jgi:hypothetical protein
MFCKNCGKKISDNSQYCRFCGAQQDNLIKNEPKKQKDSDLGKKWGYHLLKILIYILLAVLGSLVLIAFLLGKYGSVLLNLVLGISGVLGFIWILVGLPVGLIFNFTNRNKNSYNGELIALLTLGGFIMLAVVFSAYALLYIVKTLFGLDLIQVGTV